MTRLPTPGGDDNQWGDILNQYLLQSHKSDGTLKDGVVSFLNLDTNLKDQINSTSSNTGGTISLDGAVTGPATSNSLKDGAVSLAHLDTALKNQLNAASNSTITLSGDVTGSISSTSIKDGAITATKIADGAVDSSKLASGVSASINGKIDKSVVTQKGDLLAGTAASAVSRIGVGANGQILTVDNSTPTGVKWADVSATSVDTFINVRDHGAVGDGVTDDTDAINAAIQAGAGKTVYLPGGSNSTYLVNPIKNGGNGILMNVPGVRLLLDSGVVMKAKTVGTTSYSVVYITSPDCTIEGGIIEGDVGSHTGTTGEWGFGINIWTGADRCRVVGTEVRKCWGDGIYINGANDVRLVDVQCLYNRRQGLSIVNSERPRIIGGSYSFTGKLGATAPSAGIDLEPNPGGGPGVFDAIISGVTAEGNVGPGILAPSITGTATRAVVSGCSLKKNGSFGFWSNGSGGNHSVSVSSTVARENTSHGFYVLGATGAVFQGCTAISNGGHGFYALGLTQIISCYAERNQQQGIVMGENADNSIIVGGGTRANGQSGAAGQANVQLAAANIVMTGHTSTGEDSKPALGINVSSVGLGARIIGCNATGSYLTYAYGGITDTVAIPRPSATKRAAITSPTADAASLKTAVDQIIAAIRDLGITS